MRIESSHEKYHQPIDSSIRAGQLQQSRCVTEKVRNHIVSTEGQPGHEQGVQRGMGSGQHPGQRQQSETEPGAHDGSVVQGEADGHVAVIGHGHKQEALKNSKKQVKIHLGQTACIGDGQGMALHILQQLRHSDRGEAEVRERQVTEK